MTQEELKKLVEYDKETGEFFRLPYKSWRATANRKLKRITGHKRRDGYILIGLNYQVYLAHRLAWLYEYGCWPSKVIDHIDRDPSNNRITNLRDVSQSENILNSRRSKTVRGN